MDNVTHTLIGITLGSALFKSDTPIKKAAIWTAVIGNNIPDLDFMMTPFLSSGSLGYLLHHRGYTHSLLAAFILGPLSAVLGTRISGSKKIPHLNLYILGWV